MIKSLLLKNAEIINTSKKTLMLKHVETKREPETESRLRAV